MLKKFLYIPVLALILLFSVNIATFAQENEAKLDFSVSKVESKWGKVTEKISLILKFSAQSKVDYYKYILEKRLAELTYVIESDQIDLVEPTASRYATYSGIVSDFVINKKVTTKKEELIKTFERHEKLLLQLQSKFEHDSGWWLAIQHDINNTKSFRDKLGSL